MTPEERGERLRRMWELDALPIDSAAPPLMAAAIAEQIREAVAAERERCANLVFEAPVPESHAARLAQGLAVQAYREAIREGGA